MGDSDQRRARERSRVRLCTILDLVWRLVAVVALLHFGFRDVLYLPVLGIVSMASGILLLMPLVSARLRRFNVVGAAAVACVVIAGVFAWYANCKFVKAYPGPDGTHAEVWIQGVPWWAWNPGCSDREPILSFLPSVEFRRVSAYCGDELLNPMFWLWPRGEWSTSHRLCSMGEGFDEWHLPSRVEWVGHRVRVYSGKGSVIEFEIADSGG